MTHLQTLPSKLQDFRAQVHDGAWQARRMRDGTREMVSRIAQLRYQVGVLSIPLSPCSSWLGLDVGYGGSVNTSVDFEWLLHVAGPYKFPSRRAAASFTFATCNQNYRRPFSVSAAGGSTPVACAGLHVCKPLRSAFAPSQPRNARRRPASSRFDPERLVSATLEGLALQFVSFSSDFSAAPPLPSLFHPCN